jgi:23S rRNA (pseudouridine1915-N3)-methyltransferase
MRLKITILCVGKIKEKFYQEAVAEYKKRLSRYCNLEIIEVADEKTPDHASETVETQIKEKEAGRMEKYIKEGAYVCALAIEGKQADSVELSEKIEGLGTSGISHIIFIIGGSLGLSAHILNRADWKLSFSKMTFPHQLMRVILLEQIYRSYRIMNGEPYHK